MRVLVTFISRSEGASKRRDKVFETATVTLGRGTDQTIHLRDPRTALEHATLVSRDGGLVLRALTLTGVMVNDKICRYAKLRPGDRIRVGENLLTIVEPPQDFDFALTFELDPDVSTDAAAPPHYKTRLSDTGLRPRRWAWIAALAVLVTGLLVPAMVLLNQSTADLLRATPLPDDRWWSSGPLSNVHRSIGADCLACHTPFKRTPNHLCMECHTDVRQHVTHDDTVALDELSQRRCAQCHREHNEPASLVRRDQIVCTDCHAGIAQFAAQTELRDVSGFIEGHASFSVSMLIPAQTAAQWETARIALDDPNIREQSGLKFPHNKHLVPEGIKGADGDVVLRCDDCHLPLGGGAVMRPIDMVRDCQGCHPLDFEPADPDRQVPHAQTDVVLRDMEEYYAWRYLYGLEDTTELGIDPAVFRLPGKISDRGARERLTQAAAAKAMEIGDDLIHRRTCANCHEIESTEQWPGIIVAPTRLTQRWLPKGRFDHAAHRVFDCVECHAAENSKESSDVLIPDIDTCGDCHAGTDVAGKIISSCIDCHGFHQEGAGPWPQ